MFYADVIHSVNINVMAPPTTARTLRSGNSYVIGVTPARARGGRGSARSTSNRGRGRSRSIPRGRGPGRSLPPPTRGRGRASASTSRSRAASRSRPPIARAPRSVPPQRRTTAAPSIPVVQPTPPLDSEAIRNAMASTMGGGLFDSDEDSDPEDDGIDDGGRGGLVFTPPPLPSFDESIRFRGFANAPSKSQMWLLEKMSRSEKKNNPDFKLISTDPKHAADLFDLLNERFFEFGNAAMGSAIVPTTGSGLFLQVQPTEYKEFALGNYLDLGNPKNLFEEAEAGDVSMEMVLAFAGLINGGEDALFEVPTKGPDGFYKYVPVDPNAPGRRGELNRIKIATRDASQSLLFTVMKNSEHDAWKFIQLKCAKHRFRCVVTKQIIECGEIWLRALITILVPSTKMRGLEYKAKFAASNFKKFGFDPSKYLEYQSKIQNKIQITMGLNGLTDQVFLEKMFTDFDTSPALRNVDYWNFVLMKEKSHWANSNSINAKSKDDITGILLNTYRNMRAENKWNPVEEAHDPNFVALTTKLDENQKKLEKATTELKEAKQSLQKHQKSNPYPDAHSTKSKVSAASSAFSEKNWRTTNKGPETVHPKTQQKFVWCALGHNGGCYMEEGHNHEVWAKERQQKRKDFEAKRKLQDGDLKPAAKKNGSGNLKLSNDMAQAALTTMKNNLKEKHFFTDHELDAVMGVKEESKD